RPGRARARGGRGSGRHLAGARRDRRPGQQAARVGGATAATAGARTGPLGLCRAPAPGRAAGGAVLMHHALLSRLRRIRPRCSWLLLGALLLGGTALGQDITGITSQTTPDGTQQWSIQLQTLLLLSGLAFLPAILLLMTGFTRIVIVLGLLRTAIGTQSAPPNQVLLGIALFLTFFVMGPVFDRIYESAWLPLAADTITFEDFLSLASQPL